MQDSVALREVMTREFVGVSESDSLAGAARLCREADARTAVVLRGGEPVGVVSCRELLAFVADGGDPAETPVSAVMGTPRPTLSPDDPLAVAAGALTERGGELLVADGSEVVGVVGAADVLAATAARGEFEPPAGAPNEREAAAGAAGDAGSVTTGSTERSGDGAAGGYSSQSICERCGSLAGELVDVDGQLLCANCRDV